MVGALSLAAGGCGSAPPIPCTPCTDRIAEIQHLRQDVASRDVELRELRSDQRAQVKVLQESRREATRVKVKLHRLATRADAASYIAEVEVALDMLRSSHPARPGGPQLLRAQRMLESAEAPFAQGQYGVAMDRAAEAERLITLAADEQARRAPPARASVEARRRVNSPLKPSVARGPREKSLGRPGGVGVSKQIGRSVALAHERGSMRADADSGALNEPASQRADGTIP
jgi:hypothetical protein